MMPGVGYGASKANESRNLEARRTTASVQVVVDQGHQMVKGRLMLVKGWLMMVKGWLMMVGYDGYKGVIVVVSAADTPPGKR